MKHNVKAYLEASGKYNRLVKTREIDLIVQLMEGYGQICFNKSKNI